MSTAKTPIALFAYNRPQHTDEALSALARCSRLDECELRIFCDGPKDPTQGEPAAATRAVAKRWAPTLNAQVVERAGNLGLARSVVSGVAELCQERGRAIVLEDDLIVSPDFLDYMLQALDRYEDAATVYQVSGYMFDVEHAPKPDAFLLPLTSTWGWATWGRAWRAFDWDAADAASRLADARTRRRFDFDGAYPYADMLEHRLAARNDSWGILWHYAVFKAGGLVLHPRRSLVWNAGVDGTGVHCGESPTFPQVSRGALDRVRLPSPLAFPDEVAVDEAALARVKRCIAAQAPTPEPTLMGRVREKAKTLLRQIAPASGQEQG